MRRRGPAKQCLWLGPRGYLRGGGRHFAYAYTHSNSDGNAICNNNAECNSHSYTYGDDHAFTHCYAKSNGQTSTEPASEAKTLNGIEE